jgi:uncharacterized protein (TIGR00369 family)
VATTSIGSETDGWTEQASGVGGLVEAVGLTEEEIASLISRTAFAAMLGVQVTRYGKGEVEFTVPVTRLLRQHHGFIHGAVIGFAADSACAWSAASLLGDVVTAEYKINLLAPAVGEQLIGRGSATIANARNAVSRAEITVVSRGRERLVAMAQASVTSLPRANRAKKERLE